MDRIKHIGTIHDIKLEMLDDDLHEIGIAEGSNIDLLPQWSLHAPKLERSQAQREQGASSGLDESDFGTSKLTRQEDTTNALNHVSGPTPKIERRPGSLVRKPQGLRDRYKDDDGWIKRARKLSKKLRFDKKTGEWVPRRRLFGLLSPRKQEDLSKFSSDAAQSASTTIGE